MRKFITSLAFSLVLVCTAYGQVTVSLSSAEVDPNGEAVVSVTVNNFTGLITFQHSINWDSTAFRFKDIRNVNTALPDFDYTGDPDFDAIGVPLPGSNLDEGQVSVVWFNSNSQTLPPNTKLFDLVLTASSTPCKMTSIDITDTPLKIQAADTDLELVDVVGSSGTLKVRGTDCGNNGGDGDLTITAGKVQAKPGDQVCVPITVKNFVDIEGGQGSYKWDPAVLTYVSRNSDALAAGSAYNDGNIANGLLGFVANVDDPITLTDGSTFLNLCFNVIGEIGDVSPIELTDELVEWSFDDPSPIPNTPLFELEDGEVRVVDVILPVVTIKAANVTANTGTSTCVDVTVDNFTNINSMQFAIEWNPAIITFKNVGGFNLSGLMEESFNHISNSKTRLTWSPNNTQGVNLANGTKLFHICFDVIGACATSPTSPVSIVNDGSFAVVFTIDSPGDPTVTPHTTVAGSVKVNSCGTNCSVVSTKNVSCAGGTDGGINVSVPTSNTACNCVWKRADGSIFQTLPVTNCNLIGAPAGTYTLELTCGGVVDCSLTQQITQPAAIAITETISSVACGNLGAISLNIAGGNPSYNFLWAPGGQTSKDITSLTTGSYTVTVTDLTGCTSTKSFTVEEKTDPIVANPTIVDIRCFGEANGAITLNPLGGCPGPSGYTYNWSGPTAASGRTPTNLAAGTYMVTIMDNSNPTISKVETIVIEGPTAALASNPTTGAGSIALNIVGGLDPFVIVWTGPTAIAMNEQNPSGLAAGNYRAVITDAGGCSITKDITVTATGSGVNFGSVDVATAVTCNNKCDAVISGSISSGTAPFTVRVTGGANNNKMITVNALGSFSMSDVCPGALTFQVTDATGATSTRAVTVADPPALVLDAIVQCSDGDVDNGSIDLSVAGGTIPFLYQWSNGSNIEDITGLGIGRYTVVITDKNNCQATLSRRVDDCAGAVCYSAITIITPNNDGYNDDFIISCAQDHPSELRIYDRFGKEVFVQQNYANTWQGTDSNGTLLNEGSYMWVLSFDPGTGSREIFKGTVTLLRD